ncbi:hypothetical protein L9F63_023951, partial [Diploptera punctata]
YVAGRMSLISQTEAKGLNTFVGYFSLPALIFLSLAELDLSSVNWIFLLSILVSKAVVFFIVVVVTLLVSRPLNPGRAGLFAIFCTQSNDFAIGYPIVVSLYQKTHPDYASYLYLMAPISLAILNPLAFVLMEISKRKNSAQAHPAIGPAEPSTKSNKLHMVILVIKGIISNPVVLMTGLGIIGNIAFNHHLPVALSGILKQTALFTLGLRMVGKVQTLQGAALVVPGILIANKIMLVLPLVNREVVSLFNPGKNVTDTLDLSTFGFLYGVFPAAPTVFVFATQYSIDVDLMASSKAVLAPCTVSSSRSLVFLPVMVFLNDSCFHESELWLKMNMTVFEIAISWKHESYEIWVLVIFICSKKYKKVPHRITSCLVISQLIGCIGIVLWSKLDRTNALTMYLQFAVYAIGVYSSRLWTAFLAISLLFLQCRSLCFVLKLQPLFIVLGWGTPLILVTVLLLSVNPNHIAEEKKNPNFQYGEVQAAVAAFILVICFIVTVGCLVLHQRYQRRYARYLLLVQDVSSREVNSDTDTEDISSQDIHTTSMNRSMPCSIETSPVHQAVTHQQVVDIEEIVSDRGRSFRSLNEGDEPDKNIPGDVCPASFECPSSQRQQCQNIIKRYHIEETLEEEHENEEDRQTLRHMVLLILMTCSMFVGIALSIWTLIMEEMCLEFMWN